MPATPQPEIQFEFIKRIDRYAKQHPERVAFVGSGKSLSYGELKDRSDAVAGYLASTLARDESPVAVMGHKEPEMPVAFLAAAKSGHPYVPIEASLPQARIDRILSASGASMTLTPELVAKISQEHSHAPNLDFPLSHPIYVMFTSGSTGEPKGVVITRGCLQVFLEWMLTEQQFKEHEEVFLNQAPFSFDLSIMDFYLGLITGGTIVCVTRADTADPERLSRRLATSGVTVWVSTPSFAEMCLVDSRFRAEMLPRLAKFLFCGEMLAPHLVAALLERFPQAEIWNTYGPTETTVATTSVRITPAILKRHRSLPIGYPMPAGQIVLHDEEGRCVDDGERGEIIIIGPNVSPGYFKRPDLTERAFFTLDGERAYRTGDWGRYVAGLLFYEGRRDRQVKLRGHRIEPSEIERHLRAMSELRDAAVVPLMRDGRVDALAAYVVADPNFGGDHEALSRSVKAKLSAQLPPYMVPTWVMVLDFFPMTPNGKVDLQALPPPGEEVEGEQEPASGAQSQPAGSAIRRWIRNKANIIKKRYAPPGKYAEAIRSAEPRTSAQETLAGIWCDVLNRKRVGIRDNFFDLGGHSLAAVRLMARIENAFGKKIPLTAIFQWPTIEQLEAFLRDARPEESASLLLRLQPSGSHPPFFWIHGDQSNVSLPLLLSPEQPIYGLMHQGHDGSRAQFKTVESIAAHYLQYLTSVQPYGPYFLGGFSFGGLVAFEIAQQIVRKGEPVALLFLADPDRLRPDGSSYSETDKVSPPAVSENIFKSVWRHLRNLSRMSLPQTYEYLWTRVRGKVNGLVWRRLLKLRKRIACGLCDLFNLNIPEFLRSYYILEVYRGAGAVYNPSRYPGSVVLIAGEEASRCLPEWRSLAAGGLIVRGTSGDHLDLVKGPNIQKLADELKRFLAEAQSGSASPPPASAAST